jgi:hypothetical protein
MAGFFCPGKRNPQLSPLCDRALPEAWPTIEIADAVDTGPQINAR